jgi:hypothetical protein
LCDSQLTTRTVLRCCVCASVTAAAGFEAIPARLVEE